MKREARTKFPFLLAALFALAVGAHGCGSDEPVDDDTGGTDRGDDESTDRADAGRGPGKNSEDASTGSSQSRDAGRDAARDSGRNAERDAGAVDARADSEAGEEPSPSRDASSDRDGTVEDAGQRDAATGSSGGMRARICGDKRDFPSPLPDGMKQVAATAVGEERFGFVEGPVWVEELGALLFSDMNFSGGDEKGPPAQIRRLVPPSTFDVFSPSSGSNGLALFDGAVLAATHDTQSLSMFDLKSGKRTDLTIRYQGRAFNSPNDLTVRSDGTVYFSDPDWQVGQRPRVSMGVYRVSPPLRSGATLEAQLVEGMLDKPNGVALSPDERTLYVGSTGNEVWKYTVASDGSVSNRTKFADTGASDGMTVDCAGNLYVTANTVKIFAPDGTMLGEVTTGDQPSNVAFGGDDRKTLYITAQSRIYRATLAVPGYPY